MRFLGVPEADQVGKRVQTHSRIETPHTDTLTRHTIPISNSPNSNKMHTAKEHAAPCSCYLPLRSSLIGTPQINSGFTFRSSGVGTEQSGCGGPDLEKNDQRSAYLVDVVLRPVSPGGGGAVAWRGRDCHAVGKSR